MKKTMNIDEAVVAVQAATTEDAIKAVLEGCTKETIVRLSMRTHERVFSLQMKKADMIERFVSDEMLRREDEAFRALSVEEKIRLMAKDTYAARISHLANCTNDELEEIIMFLNVKLPEDKISIFGRRYVLQSTVNAAFDDVEDIDALFNASYEAVKAAYLKFEIADNDYYEKGTAELKAVRDASYEEYRRVLAEYTEKPSPQKDEVRAELIRKYGNSEHTLSHLKSINKRTLVEMSHKAGIHADYVETPAQDVAVRLLRWAGIDCEAETYAEQAEREYREEIDWLNARIEQKRAEYLGLVEALRALEGSKNYGALLALKGKVQQEYREVRLESWQYRREHDAKEQKAA